MLEYKSFLNHTDPIEIKSDFCLTNAQWRERERERERERDFCISSIPALYIDLVVFHFQLNECRLFQYKK